MRQINPENYGRHIDQVIDSMVEILSKSDFAIVERMSNHKLMLLLRRIVNPDAATKGKSSLRAMTKAIQGVKELEWLEPEQIADLRARAFKFAKEQGINHINWENIINMPTNDELEKSSWNDCKSYLTENEPIHPTHHPMNGVLTKKGLLGSVPGFGEIVTGETGTWHKDPLTGEHSMLVSPGNTFRWKHPWLNYSTVFEQSAYKLRRREDTHEKGADRYAKELRELRKEAILPAGAGLTGEEVALRIELGTKSKHMHINPKLDVETVLTATVGSNDYLITVDNWHRLGLTDKEKIQRGFKEENFAEVRQESVNDRVVALRLQIEALMRNHQPKETMADILFAEFPDLED